MIRLLIFTETFAHINGPYPDPKTLCFSPPPQPGSGAGPGEQDHRGPPPLQRDHLQQHAKEGEAQPGPAVLLPGGRAERAHAGRDRHGGRPRVREDHCQGEM